MIKDIFISYECDPRIKHYSNLVNTLIDNFFNSINCKAFPSYYSLINSYTNSINELDKTIMNDLYNLNKGSVLVRQHNNISLDEYIQKESKTCFSKSRFTVNYSYDLFYKSFLFEVSLILAKYDKVYDFILKLSQLKLLLLRFNFSIVNAFDNSYSFNISKTDFDNIYNSILDVNMSQINSISNEIKLELSSKMLVHPVNNIQIKKTKPTCKEDLTDLFDEDWTQPEKIQAIKDYWNCSDNTARKYMKQFNCYIDRKINEVKEEIVYSVNEAKEEMITISKRYFEEILAELKALREENKQLREKIEVLERNQTQYFQSFNTNSLNNLTL